MSPSPPARVADLRERLAKVASREGAFTFGRGVEREALRVTRSHRCRLAQTPHPEGLGSALRNKWITTDFSESQVELITSVCDSVESLLGELTDIHKFSLAQAAKNGEAFWPFSMPCHIDNEDEIPIAKYGSSNVGKMKTLYRVGLKGRYGSMMQAISGVHFNFSFPDAFWDALLEGKDISGTPKAGFISDRQAAVSHEYFGLIRNYYRFGWLIPYLFGSSPAIMSNFVDPAKTAKMNFVDGNVNGTESRENGNSSSRRKDVGGWLYLPTATALRLSDLGYTNDEQNSLQISFNSLPLYVGGLCRAISTPSAEFAKLGVKAENGSYKQLNANVLQIENELYAPIRAKRVAASGEKPTEALCRGGVEYIEVRSLDCNPFDPIGISEDQVRFLDTFLTWAILSPSEKMGDQDLNCWYDNWKRVVVDGRNPDLMLRIGCHGERLSRREWGIRVFAELKEVAKVLDENLAAMASAQLNGEQPSVSSETTGIYQATIERLAAWNDDADLTFSGQVLKELAARNGIMALGDQLAEKHSTSLMSTPYTKISEEEFVKEAQESVVKQIEQERADANVSFDEFLESYFAETSQRKSSCSGRSMSASDYAVAERLAAALGA